MRTIYILVSLLFTALSSYRLVVEGVPEVDELSTTTITEETASDSALDSSTSTTATTTSDDSATAEESIEREQRKYHKASTAEESSISSTKSTVSRTSKDLDDSTFEAIQLNSRNFGKHISDGNIWLIEFYSPHCSHCVEFASSYADVAKYYHSQSVSGTTNTNSKKQKKKIRHIKVAKVNGEIERALVSRFSINAYPCFFLIDGFDVYKYEGLRLKKNLMAFAEGGYKIDITVSFFESPII